jgi:hypothetical protein
MCIIVYKPIGVELPSKETLKNCFDNNPDGAGFMYRKGREIRIRKGYMKFKSFYQALKNISRVNGGITNTDLLMHFRIATHGTIEPGQTHPFPVSENYTDLVREKITTKQALAHNGILTAYAPPEEVASVMSDTMWFIAQNAGDIQTPLKNGVNGKFVLMNTEETLVYGQFTMDAGVYYSNDSYRDDYMNLWYGGLYGGGFTLYGKYNSGFKSSRKKIRNLFSHGKKSRKSSGHWRKPKYDYTDWENRICSLAADEEEEPEEQDIAECYYCGLECDVADMFPCEDGSQLICPDCRDELLECDFYERAHDQARDYWEEDYPACGGVRTAESPSIAEAQASLGLLFPETLETGIKHGVE